MRTTNRIVCFSLLMAMIFACGSPRKQLTEIDFLSDYQAANKAALEMKLPMIIVFYSQDCPWCKMLDDSTFTNKVVIEMSADMVFVRLNALKDSLIAQNLGITLYPTIVVARHDGSEVDRLVGYYPPAEFFNEVQLYLQGAETLDDYLKRLEDEPDNIDYLLIVAEKYRNHSDWDAALEYYSNVVKLSSEDTYEVEDAMFEIAGVTAQKEEYSAAISLYKEFIKRFPDSDKIDDASRRIPYCLTKNNDFKKALDLYKKYINDYPDSKHLNWVNKRIDEIKKVL